MSWIKFMCTSCEITLRWMPQNAFDDTATGIGQVQSDPDLCHHMASLGHNEFNTLRPRQNGRHFADAIFKWIFLNENVWIPIKFSLKFVPQGPINNIPALVQIMAWRRPGDKPLSGPMMVRLPTHICVTRPQWGNTDTDYITNYEKDSYTERSVHTAFIAKFYKNNNSKLALQMTDNKLGIILKPWGHFNINDIYIYVTVINGLEQDCSNSSVLPMELPQSRNKLLHGGDETLYIHVFFFFSTMKFPEKSPSLHWNKTQVHCKTSSLHSM